MSKPKYEPENHLTVALVQSGSDLIQLSGKLWGLKAESRRVPDFIIMDMEEAVDRATKALRAYKNAAGVERLDEDEFEALSAN